MSVGEQDRCKLWRLASSGIPPRCSISSGVPIPVVALRLPPATFLNRFGIGPRDARKKATWTTI
jgi:hypothetical protein